MHCHLHAEATPDRCDPPKRESKTQDGEEYKKPCHFHGSDLAAQHGKSTLSEHWAHPGIAQFSIMTELKSAIIATDLASGGNRLLSL